MSFEELSETNSNVQNEFYEVEDEYDRENEDDCNLQSFACYANGTFLKLRDRGIKHAAALKYKSNVLYVFNQCCILSCIIRGLGVLIIR